MYPNPTKGIVTVKGDDVSIGSNITIYNTIGQEVFNSIINSTNTVIDLKSLGNSGMYFIRVSKANRINTTKKIILD